MEGACLESPSLEEKSTWAEQRLLSGPCKDSNPQSGHMISLGQTEQVPALDHRWTSTKVLAAHGSSD